MLQSAMSEETMFGCSRTCEDMLSWLVSSQLRQQVGHHTWMGCTGRCLCSGSVFRKFWSGLFLLYQQIDG